MSSVASGRLARLRHSESMTLITYALLLLMMTCADAELAFRGLGPPPVPRRISLVFAPASTEISHVRLLCVEFYVVTGFRARSEPMNSRIVNSEAT